MACSEPSSVSEPAPPPPPARAADIIGGDDYACALLGDNSLRCTGSLQGVSSAATDYTRISGGRQHACGLRVSGAIRCWGVSAYGKLQAPSGEFREVTAGTDHSCALREDGSIACWGLDESGQTRSPAGAGYLAVTASAGGHHTCALDAARAIVCWGANEADQTSAPAGTGYRLLAVTARGGCAVDAGSRVRCWGESLDAAPEFDGFSMMGAGNRFVCAIRQGQILCWGHPDAGGVLDPPDDTDFVRVGTGYSHACALRANGSVRCWGSITTFPGIAS
jgi:alpha-tubulin suppressor-like RCC1 family protein